MRSVMSVARFGWRGADVDRASERRENLLKSTLDRAQIAQVRAEFREPASGRQYDVNGPIIRTQTVRDRDGLLHTPVLGPNFDTLKPHELLSNEVIEAFTSYLNKLEHRHNPLNPRVVAIPFSLAETVWLPRGLFLQPTWANARYAVAIVNTSEAGSAGFHWVTYFAHMNHQLRYFELHRFDSLSTGGMGRVDDKVRIVFSTLFGGQNPYTCSPVQQQQCPQQHDGVQCGIFTLAFMFHLWNHPKAKADGSRGILQSDISQFPNADFDPEAARRVLAHRLMAERAAPAGGSSGAAAGAGDNDLVIVNGVIHVE